MFESYPSPPPPPSHLTILLPQKEWLLLNKYRISDVVHMAEIEIIRRLHADGAFPWMDMDDDLNLPFTQLRMCFIMRRHPPLRYQFAAAVGKRLFSTKVVATQRAQIMEHKRAAAWAEQEYAALYRFMCNQGGAQEFSSVRPAGDFDQCALTCDYIPMITGTTAQIRNRLL